MLEVRNLCHHFGPTQVLYDVNFSVNQGEIVGLLGPNGAGKSTTMRILTGYLTPSSGQVQFHGQDIRANIMFLRKQLGYMPENTPLYPELKVAEYLLWAARIKRAKQPTKQTAEVMERCGLKHVAGTLIRRLSKGYQQRVGLAQSILGQPQLLILDEPTIGLDPKQIREIRTLIRELGRDKTILLSTHILPEVELTCDRALIIDRGRIIAEDTPSGLVQAFGGKGRFLLKLDVDDVRAAEIVKAYADEPGVQKVERLPEAGRGVFSLSIDGDDDRRSRLTRLAFERNWPLLEFKPTSVSLEEVFVSLVREEKTEGVLE